MRARIVHSTGGESFLPGATNRGSRGSSGVKVISPQQIPTFIERLSVVAMDS